MQELSYFPDIVLDVGLSCYAFNTFLKFLYYMSNNQDKGHGDFQPRLT